MVAAAFRTVFAYATSAEIFEQYDKVSDMLPCPFPKAAELMDGAKEELLAFTPFPLLPTGAEIWSTNPLERLNKELKKRCRVVGIFPNEAAVTRLAGSVFTSWTSTTSGRQPTVATSPRALWRSSPASSRR